MSVEYFAPLPANPVLIHPPRRSARRAGLAVAAVAAGWAAWYFCIELPDQREAVALAAQRVASARRIPDLDLDLVWMAPGTFLMGTPEQILWAKMYFAARGRLELGANPRSGNADEKPATWVTLTQPFWLGRTPVTQGQYASVMGANPSCFKGDDLPVETVSWEDAMAFCQKLSGREQAAGRLPPGYAYTLPTEAQWEYACRAGTTDDPAGDFDTMAWDHDNSGGTPHPVGAKAPNAWGLTDMHGNVWEWCRDRYGAYPGGELTNPPGPALGAFRVLRGGSWSNDASLCGSATRLYGDTGFRINHVGFRVALAPSAVAKPAASPTAPRRRGR